MSVNPIYPTTAPHRHLPRLAVAAYQRNAIVHWSMTLQNRSQGWLDENFHLHFRERLLHTLIRYELFCPAYCLRPDHLHLLWMGIAPAAHMRHHANF